MVAVAGEVADFDTGVGQGFLDEAFNFGGGHGHKRCLSIFVRDNAGGCKKPVAI